MTASRTRRTETLIYTVLWVIAVGLYLLDAMRRGAQMSLKPVDAHTLWHMARTMVPFFILFLINNYLLIPRLLFRNRLTAYFLAASVLVLLLWTSQYFSFMEHLRHLPAWRVPAPHPPVGPLLPLPLLLDFTYALLVVGCNLAIALMFQRFDDRLEKESMMKNNAEARLEYLKAQINPHFYMNMLNNIHGMIEIDPAKAQGMVIDMSRLMRYMLYESSRPLISLADEVAFLDNYMRLMRQRFPADRLDIATCFPLPEEMRGVSIPPLLTLVFIENAFKHGVSYRERSFVDVSLDITDAGLVFRCVNSRHPDHTASGTERGIGLSNIRQRLCLLYGTDSVLDISATDTVYTVTLTIPCHETTHTDNR